MGANGNTKRRYENAMPVTDEGWWESVLTEERRYSTYVSHSQPATHKCASCMLTRRTNEWG